MPIMFLEAENVIERIHSCRMLSYRDIIKKMDAYRVQNSGMSDIEAAHLVAAELGVESDFEACDFRGKDVMEKIDLEDVNVPNIVEVLHRKNRRIQRLESKIETIKKHWFDNVPPFTMPFLDCQDETVQRYIQDMTEWARVFGDILEDRNSEGSA